MERLQSTFFYVSCSCWGSQVHFVNNHVFDNLGPSMRIERCLDNPHMGTLLGNVVVGNAEQRPLSPALQQALDRGLCTRRATADQHDFQPWFVGNECFVYKGFFSFLIVFLSPKVRVRNVQA